MIRPKQEKNDPKIGAVAVMVAMEKDLTVIRRAMGLTGRAAGRFLNSKIFVGNLAGRDIAMVGPMLGAPYAVMILEKLAVLGAQKVLFLGWCGSVQEKVCIGDFIIPEQAVIGEGTSRYYASVCDTTRSEASPMVIKAIEQQCAQHGPSIHKGPVWSTDAPYRETSRQVLWLRGEGVLGVDMEVSAVFTVGRFRHLKTGALLVVSDELASLKWQPGFTSQKFNRAREMACEVIVETCKVLCNNEGLHP